MAPDGSADFGRIPATGYPAPRSDMRAGSARTERSLTEIHASFDAFLAGQQQIIGLLHGLLGRTDDTAR